MSIALEVKKSEENESARGDKRRSFFAPTVCKLNSIFRRRNKSTRDFVARLGTSSLAFLVSSRISQSTCGKSTYMYVNINIKKK